MGRVFKPKYAWTKADGTRVEKTTEAWYVEYTDATGRCVRRKGRRHEGTGAGRATQSGNGCSEREKWATDSTRGGFPVPGPSQSIFECPARQRQQILRLHGRAIRQGRHRRMPRRNRSTTYA